MEQTKVVLTKQIVQQWADALRSGKYVQCKFVPKKYLAMVSVGIV